MSVEPFLDIENLTVVLPNSNEKLFSNFNLIIPDRSITGLLGSNGSGKTVLAKTLAGLYKIKSGKISLFGNDITKIRPTKRLNQLSLSFQMLTDTFLKHTVKEEIGFNYKLLQERKKNIQLYTPSQINEKNFIQEKENQHPLTLSGGEKRKLSYYLLKMNDPELFILDEPTVGLDYFEVTRLINEIKLLSDKKKKILIITHDIQFLLALTDYAVILQKNEISRSCSVLYQGSLTDYLINQTDQASTFLTIPLEFQIYMQKIMNNELSENIPYQKFLELSSN